MGWLSDYTGSAQDLAAQGRNGDTMLAHINPQEAALLKSLGGSGTINPETGLPEFWFGSDLGGSLWDAGSSAVSSIGDAVSGGVSAIRDVTGGLASGIESATGLNLSDPATIAALGLAAYGYYDPEAFGMAGAGSSEAAGWDAATAGAYGGPEASSALTNTSLGQGTNLASTGTGLQATGSLGAQGIPSTSPIVSSDFGYGGGGLGATAPSTAGPAINPAWSESVAPAANGPMTLSDIGSSAWQGAKDAGSYMMNNKLGTAMAASSLYDMYAKKQMAEQLKKQREQQQTAINNFYAPGSPEYNALLESSRRSAAAAGRPFDTSQFQADIAAKIADKKMSAMNNANTSNNSLLSSQMTNQYGGLNTMFNNMAMYTMLKKQGYA